jgi:hypothetical protein
MRCRLGWMLPVLAAGLGGCTVPPQETPAEALARRQLDWHRIGLCRGHARLPLVRPAAADQRASRLRRSPLVLDRAGHTVLQAVLRPGWW